MGYSHLQPGFKSEDQRRAFKAAARDYEKGGPLAAMCGARLPGGKTCAQLPLTGGKRCLQHGGPHAARRHRERQLQGLQTGRVTPAEFNAPNSAARAMHCKTAGSATPGCRARQSTWGRVNGRSALPHSAEALM